MAHYYCFTYCFNSNICFAQSQNLIYNINHSLTEFIYIYINIYIYIYIYIYILWWMDFWQIDIDQERTQCFPERRGMPPYLLVFLKTTELKLMPTPIPHSPNLGMKPPHWKVNPPSNKLLPEKIFKKSETVTNTCVSLIK